MDLVFTAILLSFFAGISTVFGSLIVFLIKDFEKCHLSNALAFSAGVMITIAFVELLPEGIKEIGYTNALIIFFTGAIFIFLIDHFIPHDYILEKASRKNYDSKLLKTGIFIALGLAIHNFPEGFAVFAGTMQSMEMGLTIALAIALHNIPEGIAIAIPIFYATKKKRNALKVSILAGLAEPLGAIIGAIILLPFLSAELIAMSLTFVAGIMVYISVDELFPTAVLCANGNSHMMTFSFLAGSAVMGATLVMLA